MQRIVNLQLQQGRNVLAFSGPAAKSRARFEVHGEVLFGSDLIAYHSSADAGTLVGAPRGMVLAIIAFLGALFVLV
jgi:hypothetical protein